MEIKEELEKLIRELYDSDKYVIGIMTYAKDDGIKQKLIDYIKFAKTVGDDITVDEVLSLAVSLKQKFSK